MTSPNPNRLIETVAKTIPSEILREGHVEWQVAKGCKVSGGPG